MATNGIRLITPTSVAVTGAGSSATINAGGSVTFATAATLSLNGVFSSTYDNYVIDIRYNGSTSNTEFRCRLRASGSDNSTASSYVQQTLTAVSTTVSGSRTTVDRGRIGNVGNTQRSGVTVYLYGPYLAQPTASRSVTAFDLDSATIVDFAFTHNQSTAYDGITLYPESGSMTGLVKVYGLVQ